MKYIYKSALSILIAIFLISAAYFAGCKKIDLKRIAVIETGTVSDITSNSAEVNGNVIDLGTNPASYGFCWKKGGAPEMPNDPHNNAGKDQTGIFNSNITNLDPNSDYSIRSYIEDETGYSYGDVQNFKTLSALPGEWLHYDDGVNYDAIGFTSGGSFDVAIRLSKANIQQYAGASVTQIKFFPRDPAPTEYYVTVWEGSNPPDLILVEFVPNPNIDNWTTFTLPSPHLIDVSKDLWVGYWIVDHPENTFPAGVDEGPAISGYGDMISSDGGETWDPLSEIDPPNLDYNWNIQAYIVDAKGREVLISREIIQRNPKQHASSVQGNEIPKSKNQGN